MKTNQFTKLFLITCAIAAATGCASSPSRFYTLNSTATGDGATPAVSYGVAVGPVSIPALVDRPQFMVQVATNRIEVDEFNRWAEPLNNNIARVIAGDLAALLGTPQVATAPLANFNPAYRVSIDIQRFESVRGKSVLIEAVWVVHRTTPGGTTCSGRTIASEPASGDSFDALAAAHSRALAKVSNDIAAVIRTETDAKP
ncbi:MAG: PqiC family protein [Verrucomicrobiia bacterium]